jgi:uncharacterized protein YcaQ
MISRLGFVQLDTIRVVARAHDHILWTRNQNYREAMLNGLLSDERRVFEHFTHDASVLPIETYPFWQRQFRRKEQRKAVDWRKALPGADERAAIRARIALEGPLSTQAFESGGRRTEMWGRPPHKLALDYMWYAGELATSHREGFRKFYDLAERVIPEQVRSVDVPDDVQLDWLCRAGLERLAFATAGELMRFWEAASLSEVKAWCAQAGGGLVEVEVQSADGRPFQALAPGDIEARLAALANPTSRLRIINPFDPLVRDRARLQKVFGFDYRIEIFVPASRRQWGYYVFPLLEGERFVGRIDVRAERRIGQLQVQQFWPEPGIRWSGPRCEKLAAELQRMARFVGMEQVVWQDGALRAATGECA